MCNYAYHHYPGCGHISNWSMTSCKEYTNKLRLAGPECSISCTDIKPSHDLLLSTQPSMCVQCEREWTENLSHGDNQTQPANSYRTIEGLDVTGHLIEVNARMVSPSPDDRDTSSTDHSDNGQAVLGAVVDPGNGDVDSAGHSDNGHICSRAVADEPQAESCGSLTCSDKSGTVFHFARTNPSSPEIPGDLDSFVSTIARNSLEHLACNDHESEYAKGSIETEFPDTDGAVCASPSDTSSYDTDSSDDSLCGSDLIRYNILKLRIDGYVEKRQRQQEMDTEHEQHDADTFGMNMNIYLADIDDPHVALEDTPPLDSIGSPEDDPHVALEDTPPLDSIGSPEDDHASYEQSSLDIDIVQQRIEATVLKRIEENNEKEARQEATSKRLDTALLQKDQDDRREQNAALGIEEDPYIWDTESMIRMWQAKKRTVPNSAIPISPRTCIFPKSAQAPTPPPQHMYMGSMFGTEASTQRCGLREVRPYQDYEGEWEGFMMAESEDDANRKGLLDPIHVRGCCSARTADFHLFYGMMHASSEEEAEKRWLEDIRRVPGEDGKFYGLLRADDLRHARAMGLTDIRHPWGCCKDALFTMPERVRHRYSGFMCAISLEEVGHMGLCDAQPVPGECGDYYGGTYSGYVEAYCELDAFQMGLKEPEHDDDCCAKVKVKDVAISAAGQYTYYGYMYGRSEEEVVNRGLEEVLLVPGFDIKYSGNLRASSEEEAKAMGLFEPSRIE